MPPFLCYFILGHRAIPEPGSGTHYLHPKRTTDCAQGQLSGRRELFDKLWPNKTLELLEKKLEEVLTLTPSKS